MSVKITNTCNFALDGEVTIKIWRSVNMLSGFNVHGSWEFINNRKNYKTVGFYIDCFGETKVRYSMPEDEEMYYSCGNSLSFMLTDLKRFYTDPEAAKARGIEVQKNCEDIWVQQGNETYLINRGLLPGMQFEGANEVLRQMMMYPVISDIVIYKLLGQELAEVIHLVTP